MKKFIPTVAAVFLSLSALFSPFVTPLPAYADDLTQSATTYAYACIRSADVYLYEKESGGGLFILPYTYYVKILAEGVDYCYVQYQTDTAPYKAVYGYCKTEQLTFVDYTPKTPYLSYVVEATYRLDGADNAFVGDSILSTVTVSYAYYGDYTVGASVYHYVTLNGKTGYLPKQTDISYELNTEYEQRLPEAPPSQDVPAATETNIPVASVALFALLCLLAVGFVYYLLRPHRDGLQSPAAEEYGFSKDDAP